MSSIDPSSSRTPGGHSSGSRSGTHSGGAPESVWGRHTRAVRAGFERSSLNEHAEPIITTSSYLFASAAQAAARFAGDEPGLIYSRFTNPTVQTFERRLAELEGTEACMATASGMAAISMLMFGCLRPGDQIVATRNMFGSTVNLFRNILPRFGLEVVWVDGFAPDAWAAACTSATRFLYLETPTNPLTEVADIQAMAEVAHAAGAELVVDNCFCTPELQRPLEWGADIVIHSATKYLDGQGRCIGGAVAGSQALIDTLMPYMRSVGPCMSPFNAWVFLKGLETLPLRMQQHSRNARQLAAWLESQPQVSRVYYPGLASHPQHALAARQQDDFGGIVSFELAGGQPEAWQLIDHVELFSITGNLGDSRSTITHPATTTHGRMTSDDRAAAGVVDALVRLSVGLEDIEDLQSDLDRALSSLAAP